MTKRIRKQIEWHFYNYKAEIAPYNERVRDIFESGFNSSFEHVSGGGKPSFSSTESKAIRLEALNREKCWANVVRNTFNAFRFEPEYSIMVALYIHRRNRREILSDGLWESTFYRWREKWLTYAYKLAREYKLF